MSMCACMHICTQYGDVKRLLNSLCIHVHAYIHTFKHIHSYTHAHINAQRAVLSSATRLPSRCSASVSSPSQSPLMVKITRAWMLSMTAQESLCVCRSSAHSLLSWCPLVVLLKEVLEACLLSRLCASV